MFLLKNNANAKCVFSAKLSHFCEIKKMEKEKKKKWFRTCDS